jgi:uncharacterized protein YcfL
VTRFLSKLKFQKEITMSIFRFTLISFALIFCFGCSGMKVQRYVEDNVLHSTALPKISIKVGPELVTRVTSRRPEIGVTQTASFQPVTILRDLYSQMMTI